MFLLWSDFYIYYKVFLDFLHCAIDLARPSPIATRIRHCVSIRRPSSSLQQNCGAHCNCHFQMVADVLCCGGTEQRGKHPMEHPIKETRRSPMVWLMGTNQSVCIFVVVVVVAEKTSEQSKRRRCSICSPNRKWNGNHSSILYVHYYMCTRTQSALSVEKE